MTPRWTWVVCDNLPPPLTQQGCYSHEVRETVARGPFGPPTAVAEAVNYMLQTIGFSLPAMLDDSLAFFPAPRDVYRRRIFKSVASDDDIN